MDTQAIIDIVDKKFIPGIFLKYKMKAMVKFWRKRSKNSKQRFYKLKQWSQTEQSYLQKLILLRDQVKKPLLENKLIDQYQQTLIFSNLQSMIQLATEMRLKIDSLVGSWNPISTVLAPTVQSLVIYLKIYKQYSNNFQRADKIIQELKKNPNFSNVVKVFNVEDYLIKPVQRPLQYKLFLSDYLKLLPENHVDKAKLADVLKTLLKIADEINDFVEKQIRAQKMVVLEQTFGNIIQSTREYRTQFQAEHPDFHCKVYVFNDLLFIVKNWSEGKEEKFMYMNLCGASYIIRPPDNVNFKNRMYICGSFQSIHLTFKSPEIANHTKGIIESLIGELYQKEYNRTELMMTKVKIKKQRETMNMNRHSINNNYKWKQQYEYRMKLIVQVIGVEKRLYEKQWKIVYAVKIQLGKPQSIYQIIFYEIEELKQLQAYLKEVYPSVTVPSLDTRYKGMNPDDIKNDFTKYYEYKCILIEDFINFVIRCKELAKKPQYIMFKLKISQVFWDHLNRFSLDCICDTCNNSVELVDIRSYQSQKELIKNRKFQFCIINSFLFQNRLADIIKSSNFSKCSLQQKLMWVNSKQKRIDYSFQNRSRFGKKLGFHVSLALIGEQSEVYVDGATVNDTCRQIVEEVCLRKYIPDSSDFCLVYVHGKHQYYLDNDEYVYDAVIHIEEGYKRIINEKKTLVNANRASIFNTFSKSMDGYGEMFADYSVADEPKLYLRKYVYLSLSLDEWACEKNPERYSIILGEILRKFQQQLLLLTMDEIKIFCGLLYGAEQFNTVIFSKKIFCNQEKIRKYLPQSKWNFVDVEFLDRVREVIETQVKHCQSILSVYKSILKKFGDKTGTITQYFQGDSLDPASLSVKQKTLLIGVNHQRVIVCRRFNSISLLDFPLDKFKFRTSGDTLFIDTQQKTYCFIGNSWLFFQKLVEKYRLIYDMEKGKFDQENK